MFLKDQRTFFSLLLFLAILSSCENDIEKVKLLSNRTVEPVESANNIQILYSDSAKLQVEMRAPELNQFEAENPYIEMPRGLKATFFDDSMLVKSTITADYGVSYEHEQKMEARKNVVVVNKKGETLNTEHLIWDERKEKLISDAFVKITTKDEVIFGDGLEANQDFSKYKIFNIKGTFPIQNQEVRSKKQGQS